jgi:hypothetical protein
VTLNPAPKLYRQRRFLREPIGRVASKEGEQEAATYPAPEAKR